MCSRARTEAELARLVVRRIVAAEGESGARLAHVRDVVETVRTTAGAGGWPPAIVEGAIRAAWLHDVLRLEEPARLRRRIEDAGEEPDPWALAHAPKLLHAQGAAVWASARGETDPGVLSAVRHHPTAHPDWGPVGLLLYVADFCEPGRPYADRLDTSRIRILAGHGDAGLAEAARRVLGLRLAHQLATSPEWFRHLPGVTDVGLRPSHAGPFKGLYLASPTGPVPAGDGITAKEAAWLSQYTLELAAIRPEQVLKRLFKALNRTSDRKRDRDDADDQVSYDSSSFSSDAADSDGGDDAFG